jgi:predicted NAD-dependent protein-ADP-ribosyltransferase YbiA (DUF1768 family)
MTYRANLIAAKQKAAAEEQKIEVASQLKDQFELLKKELTIQDEKSDKKLNLISMRMTELESGIEWKFNEQSDLLNQVMKTLNGHLVESDKKDEIAGCIYNSTIKEIDRILAANLTLKDDYRALLGYWGRIIYEFGIKYHTDEIRKQTKLDRNEYLEEKEKQIISDFTTKIDNKIKSIRVDKKHNKLRLSEFIERSNAYASLKILITELEVNGLSDHDFAERFLKQCRSFTKKIIMTSVEWDDLKESGILNELE